MKSSANEISPSKLNEACFHIVREVEKYVVTRSAIGYDPFDALNISYNSIFFNRILKILWMQFHKRSMLNTRPIFGVKKSLCNQSIADMLMHNIYSYRIAPKPCYLDNISQLVQSLKEQAVLSNGSMAWSLGFPYQTRVFGASRNTPNAVTTARIGLALLELNDMNHTGVTLDMIQKIANFFICDLIGCHEIYKKKDSSFIPYYRGCQEIIHNASMLSALFLARTAILLKDDKIVKIADNAISFSIKCQSRDGSWFYGRDNNLNWVDSFHTGYILESLYLYMKYTNNWAYERCLKKGLQYYKENFFSKEGFPYYYPKQGVADVESAATAIRVFSLLSKYDNESLEYAKCVLNWSIHNLYDRHRCVFYYRKGRWLTNKINYMRWGQTNMLCALSIYLYYSQN